MDEKDEWLDPSEMGRGIAFGRQKVTRYARHTPVFTAFSILPPAPKLRRQLFPTPSHARPLLSSQPVQSPTTHPNPKTPKPCRPQTCHPPLRPLEQR
jgi:hypothetical protein